MVLPTSEIADAMPGCPPQVEQEARLLASAPAMAPPVALPQQDGSASDASEAAREETRRLQERQQAESAQGALLEAKAARAAADDALRRLSACDAA